MIDGPLRKATRLWVDGVAKVLMRLGAKPNILSGIAIPFAIFGAYLIATQQFLSASLVVFIASIVDALDGAIARLKKSEGVYGSYLDAMIDRVVEIIIFAGIFFLYPLAAYFAISGSTLISYAKARAAMVAKIGNRDMPAIGERGDRLTILILGLFVAGFLPTRLGFSLVETVTWVIAGAAMLGSLQRFLQMRRFLKKS
ncbi:MAG: CDP-alcohol phosphatidyltransferase family protein [Nanoarchaeota archaeon]